MEVLLGANREVRRLERPCLAPVEDRKHRDDVLAASDALDVFIGGPGILDAQANVGLVALGVPGPEVLSLLRCVSRRRLDIKNATQKGLRQRDKEGESKANDCSAQLPIGLCRWHETLVYSTVDAWRASCMIRSARRVATMRRSGTAVASQYFAFNQGPI